MGVNMKIKAPIPHSYTHTEFTLKIILKNIYEMLPHSGSGTATDVIIREYDDFHDNYNRHGHFAHSPPSVVDNKSKLNFHA